MKCSHCQNNKGGAYIDFCKGFNFNLCFDCSKKLSFIPNNLHTQIKCSSCNKYYSPVRSWQRSCTDCWIKYKVKKKAAVTFTIEQPIQRKLLGVLI